MLKQIFPISGINSNILKDGEMYHVQTEVLPNKKMVLTQIFKNGTIIHSDFVSFKKHYDELININPVKLKNGIQSLVKILHQRGLRWLKDNNTQNTILDETAKIFRNWISRTLENLKSDYVKGEIEVFMHNSKHENILNINQNKEVVPGSFMIYLVSAFQHMTRDLNIRPFFSSLETKEDNIILVSPHHFLTGIFKFEKVFPMGLAKLEIKRYYSILNELLKTKKE